MTVNLREIYMDYLEIFTNAKSALVSKCPVGKVLPI